MGTICLYFKGKVHPADWLGAMNQQYLALAFEHPKLYELLWLEWGRLWLAAASGLLARPATPQSENRAPQGYVSPAMTQNVSLRPEGTAVARSFGNTLTGSFIVVPLARQLAEHAHQASLPGGPQKANPCAAKVIPLLLRRPICSLHELNLRGSLAQARVIAG